MKLFTKTRYILDQKYQQSANESNMLIDDEFTFLDLGIAWKEK